MPYIHGYVLTVHFDFDSSKWNLLYSISSKSKAIDELITLYKLPDWEYDIVSILSHCWRCTENYFKGNPRLDVITITS